MADVVVQVKDLRVYYRLFRGFIQRLLGARRAWSVRAVDGISFEVRRGEIFGLVGESGCGKTTTGWALMGMTPVTAGEIALDFPHTRDEPRFLRPLGIKLTCAVMWSLAALYLTNMSTFFATGNGFLPLGPVAAAPAPYVTGLGVFGVLHVILGAALWTMRPWSRRPARVLAAVASAWAIPSLPFGLVLLGLHVVVLFYLGTPDPTGLVRRAGRLVPVSRFTMDRHGILEGKGAEAKETWFERWLIGPRAVKTTGFSWLLRELRSKVQMVYQDPHGALNPALTLGASIEHAVEAHGAEIGAAQVKGEETQRRAVGLLEDVGLLPAGQFYAQPSTEISGGQKQRAVIARALAPRPLLLIADEPVALLDMSIRAMILRLLLDVKERHGLTFVFITHDLATAKLVCDRIAIMYLGRIVEMGEAQGIFDDPKHPYTQALLQAIPIPDPKRRRRKVLPKGEVPTAVNPPAGCRFHPRCPVAMPTCGWEGRDFIDLLEERRLDRERAKAEEIAFGPVSQWTVHGLVASRRAKAGEAESLVERIHAALRDAPSALAEAVSEVDWTDGQVRVRFRPPTALEPKELEGRIVECLLY